MAGITERDFVALHGLLDVDHIDGSGPGMPWQLMANLQELFHSDYVTFERSNTAAQQSMFEQTLSDAKSMSTIPARTQTLRRSTGSSTG
jgi:hypothetical protein